MIIWGCTGLSKIYYQIIFTFFLQFKNVTVREFKSIYVITFYLLDRNTSRPAGPKMQKQITHVLLIYKTHNPRCKHETSSHCMFSCAQASMTPFNPDLGMNLLTDLNLCQTVHSLLQTHCPQDFLFFSSRLQISSLKLRNLPITILSLKEGRLQRKKNKKPTKRKGKIIKKQKDRGQVVIHNH